MEEELTESEEEVEEASDVEGYVGDELAVLPVCLHCDAHVGRVPHPAAATHPRHLMAAAACWPAASSSSRRDAHHHQHEGTNNSGFWPCRFACLGRRDGLDGWCEWARLDRPFSQPQTI